MSFNDNSSQAWADVTGLQRKVVVVTGAAHGIGHAIARRVAEAGGTVIAADRDADAVGAIVAELRSRGVQALAHAFDARVPAEHGVLAQAAIDNFGHLDGWVNDAGEYPIKAALDVTPDDWNEVISLNLSGYFFGSQAAARVMSDQGGAIINIASSLGYHGVPNQASYVATKFGVRGLSAALATEWGSRNIRVVAVGPGLTDTHSMRRAASEMPVEIDPFETYARMSLAKRVGVPDDIARVVTFLLTDASAYVTGSTWLVDGGEVASGGMG